MIGVSVQERDHMSGLPLGECRPRRGGPDADLLKKDRPHEASVQLTLVPNDEPFGPVGAMALLRK
jgi:hypothetical protein